MLGHATHSVLVVLAVAASAKSFAPAPTDDNKPGALLEFPAGLHLYYLKLDVYTRNGKGYTTQDLKVHQDDHKAARDVIFYQLRDSGFSVDKKGADSLVVRGVRQDDGTVVPVARVKMTVRESRESTPALTSVGKVKVETVRE